LRISLEKSVLPWSIPAFAPSAFARSSFPGLPEVTKTVRPMRFAICSAATATPPPMPTIRSDSPGFTRAFVTSIRHAVRNVSGNAADSSQERPAGFG
jgi:hypothetical protein